MPFSKQISTITPAGSEDDSVHQSLAFRSLLESLDRPGSQRRILDLGPAVGANVRFFSELSCRLFIADLTHSLVPSGAVAAEQIGKTPSEVITHELPRDETFDVVLAWDLLNYLDPDGIRSLSRQLAPLCRPGASLFALIATRKVMANRPLNFEIAANDRLSYQMGGNVQRTAPRYKEPDLSRAMVEFRVEGTFLLRNGMQEYLLTRQPDGAPG